MRCVGDGRVAVCPDLDCRAGERGVVAASARLRIRRAYLAASTRAVYLSELRTVLTAQMRFPVSDDLVAEIAERLCREGRARKFMTDIMFGSVGRPITYLEAVRPVAPDPRSGGR